MDKGNAKIVQIRLTFGGDEVGIETECDELAVLKKVQVEHAVEETTQAVEDVAEVNAEQGVGRASHGKGDEE